HINIQYIPIIIGMMNTDINILDNNEYLREQDYFIDIICSHVDICIEKYFDIDKLKKGSIIYNNSPSCLEFKHDIFPSFYNNRKYLDVCHPVCNTLERVRLRYPEHTIIYVCESN